MATKKNNNLIITEFKKLNMIYTGLFDVNNQLLAKYRKCWGGYFTKVKVNNIMYFTGVFRSVNKAKKAILKRIANGN